MCHYYGGPWNRVVSHFSVVSVLELRHWFKRTGCIPVERSGCVAVGNDAACQGECVSITWIAREMRI